MALDATLVLVVTADVLAGEPAAEEIDGLEIVGTNGSDILVTPHIGPVLRQHRTTEWVDFYLPLARHPGTLEPEIESADAGEQAPKRHRISRITTPYSAFRNLAFSL